MSLQLVNHDLVSLYIKIVTFPHMYTCIATLTYAERYCNFPYRSVVFGYVWIVTRIILSLEYSRLC